MKKMTLLRILLLLLLALLAFAGCSSDGEAGDAEAVSQETEAAEDKEPEDTAVEDAPEEDPPEEEPEEGLEISVPEAVAFVSRLSPSQLGLPGESMKIYEILPNSFIVPVDGLLCSELLVYSKNEETGTNELMGKYLVSRGSERRVYRVDDASGEAVQMDLSAG